MAARRSQLMLAKKGCSLISAAPAAGEAEGERRNHLPPGERREGGEREKVEGGRREERECVWKEGGGERETEKDAKDEGGDRTERTSKC